jgi:hypothetical protein
VLSRSPALLLREHYRTVSSITCAQDGCVRCCRMACAALLQLLRALGAADPCVEVVKAHERLVFGRCLLCPVVLACQIAMLVACQLAALHKVPAMHVLHMAATTSCYVSRGLRLSEKQQDAI